MRKPDTSSRIGETVARHLYGRMLNLEDAILLQVVRYDNFPVIGRTGTFVPDSNTLKILHPALEVSPTQGQLLSSAIVSR